MDLSVVRWSSIEYNLQDYVATFYDSFPNIIKITEGFLGKQEIDSVSSSTVIRVHSVSSQRRIIAETKCGQILSLPYKLQSLKFLLPPESKPIQGFKVRIPTTLEEILAKYSLPITVYSAKLLSYKEKGDIKAENGIVSELTLQDTYEESFLLGHPIDKGKIFVEEPIMVPMYMTELKLVVAVGLTDENNIKWKEMCEKLTFEVKSKGHSSEATFQEIFMLDKKNLSPQEPKYNSIEPIYIDISEVRKDSMVYLPNIGKLAVEEKHGTLNAVKKPVNQLPALKSETPSASGFTTLSSIPADLHHLTVSQVCECLVLLNMSQYVKAFEGAQVDGQLLYDLDQEMMKGCLGMNGLNMAKLVKFRNGWRPNLQD
ncbi:uncharacterized protein LOC134601426 [Pelobates fuscus]|uniref:uncharacterized protein LOC134601426 n=1 Tax=Pelobates fuscus TaxID=191477 RepID=UPI002FE42DC4